MTQSKPLSDSQIKQIHEELKTKGKILGKKFLRKNNIVGVISADNMYNLIKSEAKMTTKEFFETINPTDNETSELEALETANQLLDR